MAFSDAQRVCKPKRGLGEFCGGYRMCPDYCADGLECAAQETREYGPQIADLPGRCCTPVSLECAADMVPTFDEMGCPNGGCRARACGGQQPITDEGGMPLFCGRGPAHVDCPEGSSCEIAPDDRYALCCPDALSSGEGPMPGGSNPVDPADEGVRMAADCAMAQISEQAGSELPLIAASVVSGTQQVVAGIKYTLTVEAGESSACKNDGAIKSVETCPISAPTRTIDLEVLVLPAAELACALLSFSDSGAAPTCSPIMCMMYCEYGFVKDTTGCDVCICNEAPDETPCRPQTCKMACEFGFAKDDQGCELCKCSEDPNPPTTSSGLAGGFSPVADVSDSLVLRGAQCAVGSINKQSNALFRQMLVGVVSGSQQVVQGIHYKLRIQAGQATACRNDGSSKTLDDCPIAAGTVKMFDVDVIVVPWIADSCTLASFSEVSAPVACDSVMCAMYCENGFEKDANGCDMCTCKPVAPTTTTAQSTSTRLVSGGSSAVQPGDQLATAAASCAVQSIAKDLESVGAMVLLGVVSGTKQVVAGVKYHLRIRVGQSSACANDGRTHTKDECPVADSDFHGEFDVTVVLQTWQQNMCVSVEHTLVSSDGSVVLSSNSDRSGSSSSSSSSSSTTPLIVGLCVGTLVVLVAAVAVVMQRKRVRTLHYAVASSAPFGYENPAYSGSQSPSELDFN
jgi:hypothetical protein